MSFSANPCGGMGSPGSPLSRTAPPQTAPGMRMHKWRGGFATNFPPRTSTAQPLAIGSEAPWLHHTAPFEDRFHETVAVHIPEAIRHGGPAYRPNRDASKELTSGPVNSMAHPQFWPGPLAAGNGELLPNPSASCTWNVTVPPSPVPDKAYRNTARSPTRMLDGDNLLSASQVAAESGVTTSNSAL